MRQVLEIIVATYGVLLISLGSIMLIRPAQLERFITSFASSRKAHLIEMTWRLSLGISLVLLSMSMWQPTLFHILGWTIIVSSIVLLLLPWQFHQHLGSRVLPLLVRRMRLYAIGVLAFGSLLVYGVHHPHTESSELSELRPSPSKHRSEISTPIVDQRSSLQLLERGRD